MKRPYWHSHNIIDLDGQDVENFENAMINFIEEKVKYYPNSVMVFNHESIMVGDKKRMPTPYKRYHQITFEKMSIIYLQVTSRMGIVKKVTYEGRIIYIIPDDWDGADFWYLC